MKVLTIGDPHFKVNNVKETNEMCKAIYNVIYEENPDFIVVMGDTLDRHEHIHVVPFTNSINFLMKLSEIKPTYLLIGNHDRPNNSDFLSDYHPFNGLKNHNNLTLVDKVIQKEVGEFNFIFAPYVYPGRFNEALDTIENKDLNKIDIIFCHQEFYGTKMGAVVSTIGDKWSEDLSYIISGHIHDYCRPQNNIVYVGTPMQHAFGDRDDKTISLFTINKINSINQIEERRIDLHLKKKIKIHIRCEDVIKWVPPDNSLIKLIIIGTSNEIKAIMKIDYIKKLTKQGIKIHYNPTDEIKSNTSKQINLEEAKLPYAERLKNYLENRPNQLKWFNKIFTVVKSE